MTALPAFRRRPAEPFRAARSAVSLSATATAVAPPSQEIVAAVAELGDVTEEREDGLLARRFSREAVEHGLAALVLTCAEDRRRALDIQVIWNEAESEIAAVIDLAPLRSVRESADAINRYAAARMRRVTGQTITDDRPARAA